MEAWNWLSLKKRERIFVSQRFMIKIINGFYGWNKVITEICFKVTLRSDEVVKCIENAILICVVCVC